MQSETAGSMADPAVSFEYWGLTFNIPFGTMYVRTRQPAPPEPTNRRENRQMRNANGTKCNGCGKAITVKTLNTPYKGVAGVHECPRCGAVFGQCYKGDSYRFVLPVWAENNPKMEDCFYFDLTVLGSDGVKRNHGWAEKSTLKTVQVG